MVIISNLFYSLNTPHEWRIHEAALKTSLYTQVYWYVVCGRASNLFFQLAVQSG